jgi:glycosyltransferase involved in cell wall biosynthesis
MKYFQYLLITWIAVKRAQKIIVPAKFWKKMLMGNYGLPEDKIEVTYEGVSKIFANGKYQMTNGDYLLYVGNVYPHKNIPLLLQAIKKLPDQKLIIACARSVFSHRLRKMVEKLSLHDQVEFRHLVDDERLAGLYKNAQAFVTPSLIEGFGLPGLEAMVAGTPVIAANASCLPEIYGDAALYFDPSNANDLAEKIKLLLNNPKLRIELIKKAKNRAKLFSWEKMALDTWQIYQSVLH